MANVDEVEAALTNVIDPELGLDFVELGLIYEIAVDGPKVHVTYTLTTPACPIGPMVAEQIEEFVSVLDGVEAVESAMIFTPPWTPELMSDDAKFALGYRAAAASAESAKSSSIESCSASASTSMSSNWS